MVGVLCHDGLAQNELVSVCRACHLCSCLENQIRELQSVAQRHGLVTIRVFEDNGISGSVPRERWQQTGDRTWQLN